MPIRFSTGLLAGALAIVGLLGSIESSLAEAAIGLLLDPERRARMAGRARAVAEREFDVRLQIDRTLDLYREAAARVEASAS